MYPDYNKQYEEDWSRDESEDICPFVYMIPYTRQFTEFDYDEDSDGMTRQPPYSVARLLSLYESRFPKSFYLLERYRMPRFLIRRLFRTVIGYVLNSVSILEPVPQPVERFAEGLLNKLVSARPMFQNIFTFFKVPLTLSRSILVGLIVFVLNNAASA